MSLYYQDDYVTLYHGDSLEILPTLDIKADVLLTDPPYFKVKKDAWDNQWGKADQFLAWMGEWLDLTKPLLTPNASAWVFASPAMTTAVERLVGERFRVLNSIRWVKQAGWHNKAELGSLRSYLTPWEGVIFAEQLADTFWPIRDYLNHCRVRGGMSLGDIDEAWQEHRKSKGNMAGHWFGESQWQMPTEEHFSWLRAVIGPEHIRRPYLDLRREYEELRRPFMIVNRTHSVDVWHFPTVKPYKGKHPCEKPGEMLTHMIETSSRPGGMVLDPFAGSGATLETARSLDRRAIGIEQDERWCEHAANRLSRQTLDMEEAA